MGIRSLALQHTLKTAADMIFQTLGTACPELLTIVMHVHGDSVHDSPKPHQPPAFIRFKQTDPFGRSTYVSAPIDARDIKSYEPCFSLLGSPALIYD